MGHKGCDTMQKEIDESIRINVTILRADGISARIDWINEKSRPYRCFKYENGNTVDNIFLLENSLSISHGDYLQMSIDYRKLDKPINPRYTKFKLECDIWTLDTDKDTKWANFMRKKYTFPRFFDSYRDYSQFIDDCWKCERITITEKDVATFKNLDNKDIIKVYLGSAGKEKCSCGAVESNVISILCPADKIISFRSKRDYESYYDGEQVYDSHHLGIYLASD